MCEKLSNLTLRLDAGENEGINASCLGFGFQYNVNGLKFRGYGQL